MSTVNKFEICVSHQEKIIFITSDIHRLLQVKQTDLKKRIICPRTLSDWKQLSQSTVMSHSVEGMKSVVSCIKL
jgi:hypothetical protein